MTTFTVYNLVALVSLLSASLVPWRRSARPDICFWSALGLALLVCIAWAVFQVEPAWNAGFATALWLTVAATLFAYLLLVLLVRDAWQLAAILMPYLLLLGLMATLWSQTGAASAPSETPLGWFAVHVAVSLATYVLITLAAVAGAAVLVQERALKRKAPGRMSRSLPSIADAERLEHRLLVAAEIILGLGIVTGMAAQFAGDGSLISIDHKTTFALAAFVVLGGLLIAQRLWGIRGRRAARYVLIVYLLLTLAYPGVKFVTDVILT